MKIKNILKKIMVNFLIFGMLLTEGIALAEMPSSPQTQQAPKGNFGAPRKGIEELRGLLGKIKEKLEILKELKEEIKEAHKENPNPPKDARNFIEKAKQHFQKAKAILKELKKKRQEAKNLKKEKAPHLKERLKGKSRRNILNRLRGARKGFQRVRKLLLKANQELDQAIFFSQKALDFIGNQDASQNGEGLSLDDLFI